MPCSNCVTTGNTTGCPCQDGNGGTITNLQNGTRLWKDNCTGEKKQTLCPTVAAPEAAKEEYIAVKLIQKPKAPCAGVKQPCQERKCCRPERKTECYTCGPKRENCYPQDPQCYKLEYLDQFVEGFNIGQKETNQYNYFTNDEDFIANDGKHRLTKEGLIVTAKKFTKTYPHPEHSEQGPDANGFLDRFKTQIILNSEFAVPQCGELYVEGTIAARTFGTENHPFGDDVINHSSDLRLAMATLNVIDFDSGLHLSVGITNDSYWAIYERLPLDSEEGGEDERGSASFAFAKRIGRRSGCNLMKDFARVAVAIDPRKGAKWYIDGVLKHTVDRLGHLSDPTDALYQSAGATDAIKPKCVHIGFGLSNMLDAVQPDNHRDLKASSTGLVRLSTFEYKHPWKSEEEVSFTSEGNNVCDRLFGQGASLHIKEIKVELRC